MGIISKYPLKVLQEVGPFPPIQNTDNPYLTEAAMHLDQANQLEGYGYLVTDVGAFTYLGTVAGTAADYEGFRVDTSNLAKLDQVNIFTQPQEIRTNNAGILKGYVRQVSEGNWSITAGASGTNEDYYIDFFMNTRLFNPVPSQNSMYRFYVRNAQSAYVEALKISGSSTYQSQVTINGNLSISEGISMNGSLAVNELNILNGGFYLNKGNGLGGEFKLEYSKDATNKFQWYDFKAYGRYNNPNNVINSIFRFFVQYGNSALIEGLQITANETVGSITTLFNKSIADDIKTNKLDLSNLGVYANDAGASSAGVAIGYAYINSGTGAVHRRLT